MNIAESAKICAVHFEFLISQFGMRRCAEKNEQWGFSVKYKGNNVGVAICFEMREFYLFIKVSRLSNGEFPGRLSEICADTKIDTFDLDDIVLLRGGKNSIAEYSRNERLDMKLFEALVLRQSENLKKFAGDVLMADFSVFAETEGIVKKRAREAAIAKWGARAKEFGWDFNAS